MIRITIREGHDALYDGVRLTVDFFNKDFKKKCIRNFFQAPVLKTTRILGKTMQVCEYVPGKTQQRCYDMVYFLTYFYFNISIYL